MQGLQELKELLAEHPMFTIGVLLFVGYLIGKLATRLHLPAITGYIIAGLLMSHSVTGIFPEGLHDSLRIVTEIALGLVALTIGAEFSLTKLRQIGRHIMIITVCQIVIVFFAVAGLLFAFGMALPFALLLGIIATATEPAATVAEVQTLRARGRFVDYLFSIVALDDASCVILFSLLFAFVSRLLYGAAVEDTMVIVQVLWAIKEIFISLLLGIVAGFILSRMTRNKQGSNEILIIALGILFITTALAVTMNLSPLLTNLAAGSVLINLSPRNHRILRILEPLTPPVYALFFVIAGTELDYRIVMQPGLLLLGLVYVGSRGVAKYAGVYLGCRISRVEPSIRDNLGWCMLPQGGVALGLILLIQSAPIMTRVEMPEVEAMLINMLNIVLICVFFSELIGPPLSKMGLIRGAEIGER